MLRRIKNWANQNEGLLALIGVLVAIGGWFLPTIAERMSSIAPVLVDFIQQYYMIFVLIGISLFILGLALDYMNQRKRIKNIEEKIQVLENRPEILLDETESANLSNWSFGRGQWISDQDGLSVTRSSIGGFYKIGATWENYEFSFEFKIMNLCAGWIVRAKPENHFVMIQCNSTQIRPHIYTDIPNPGGGTRLDYAVTSEVDHKLELNEWNKVRTEVIGHSIKVRVNEKLVWSDSELLKNFSMGTVGFRCSRNEHALFRCIKVVKK